VAIIVYILKKYTVWKYNVVFHWKSLIFRRILSLQSVIFPQYRRTNRVKYGDSATEWSFLCGATFPTISWQAIYQSFFKVTRMFACDFLEFFFNNSALFLKDKSILWRNGVLFSGKYSFVWHFLFANSTQWNRTGLITTASK
jgi:hypothetical protein